MKMRSWIKSALAVAITVGIGSFTSIASAQVTGKVTYAGTPPQRAVIDVTGVPECAKMHKGHPLLDESLLVDAKGGLANVVIAIKKPTNVDKFPDPATQAPAPVLDQKGCQYHPHVLALLAGQEVTVKNNDPFMHNVHAQSEKNPVFNFAQPNVDKGTKTDPLKDVEYFHVKCDVHPWMSAYFAVMDNPYFAVTKADGTFEIPKGLPDGDYIVTAWQEKLDEQEGKVTVKDGKGTVDFTFKPQDADARSIGKPISPAIQCIANAADAASGDACGCSEEPDMVKAATAK